MRERSAKWILLLALLASIGGVTGCVRTAPKAPTVMRTSDSVAAPGAAVKTAASSTVSSEEAEIKNVVEGFGKRLQDVSLQSLDAARQIETGYAQFVAPMKLREWMNQQSLPPGRVVSSPWPDAIEINAINKVTSGKYSVNGNLVMMTSMEVGTGRAAGKTPVQLTLERIQDRWMITEYSEVR
jgi:hypothetical protein